MSELTKHDAIFLQVCDDDEDPWCGEVTWCQDRIHDEDVKYIRADLVEVLEAELEIERMKVVACGVVAMANTRETAEEARKMRPEYRSASLGDVERAVDCEMQYREELAEAHKQNAMMREYLERLACLGNGNRHGNSVGNCLAIEALAATADLSGLILCDAEPVAHWNGSHCDAHYRQYQGNGCMIPLYKGRKQP